MRKINNSLKDLVDFFSTEERPVQPSELTAFWHSLTDDEKAYYKSAQLS